ncbi:thermonuclease family protein [Candidatus Nitrosacidococcus tergens]|uniref:Micrococcal nuclease (SNase-like) n=1 Tax=Candidatus Nitrosacidococcus tergens TaxID=553981 RepID=A0A7G1QBY9_9GAMM|nr:thermonuclease family protein [Candidatus Nitrosacidococcus tergens]CAB1276999.1 Micrococcal nuclease (SNase-like) [Candidatus Nitrosacidococcus tergens]
MKIFIPKLKNSWLLWILLLSLFSVEAAIYEWTDAEGVTHYSDRPHPDAKEIQVKVDNPSHHEYEVESVHDGDTIRLKGGEKVRLLGINTPEIESRFRSAEPGGDEARDWLKFQLEGKKITLEFDKEKRDHYQRLLAHIFTLDGTHINLRLVEEGLAIVSLIPPNFKYSSQLTQAQNKAEATKLGIWNMAAYTPQPITKLAAEKYEKGWQRYWGTPAKIKQTQKYSYLVFNKNIDIRIPQKQLSYFDPLENYLEKKIEVRGWVNRRQNHYSILVNHPSSLKII